MITALLIALAAGVIASIAGGAIGGMLVGGKALGYDMAGFMGSFYGPIAGFPGVVVGLAILCFI